MIRILVYVVVIILGFLLSKKGFIPKAMQKRAVKFQTFSLFLLLATMGYKIGGDEKILANFHRIGMESFLISFFAITFSVALTFLVFKFLRRRGEAKW
ncbi:MAG: LysO family transporter [Fusobacteriaceae bacterium]